MQNNIMNKLQNNSISSKTQEKISTGLIYISITYHYVHIYLYIYLLEYERLTKKIPHDVANKSFVSWFNSSPLGQNDRHFADDSVKCIFVHEIFLLVNFLLAIVF